MHKVDISGTKENLEARIKENDYWINVYTKAVYENQVSRAYCFEQKIALTKQLAKFDT